MSFVSSDPLLPSESQRTEAFVKLLALHQRRIYLFILALLPHVADAEEVLQDTCIILWQKFPQFELGTDFRAWAFQIARYEVLNFFKRARREPSRHAFSEELMNEIAITAATQLDELERRRLALADCINGLPLRDRDLLSRRALPGATVASVASDVERPLEGLYKAFQRIHRLLADCIERRIAMEDV